MFPFARRVKGPDGSTLPAGPTPCDSITKTVAAPVGCSAWSASRPQYHEFDLARLRRLYECPPPRARVEGLRLDLRFLAPHDDITARLAALKSEMMEAVVGARVDGVHERVDPVRRQVAAGDDAGPGASRCTGREKSGDEEEIGRAHV